jgi:hypothetical protein
MGENIHQELMGKRWVHSHEEDKGGQMIFRPASYRFPPARGRTSFQLNADGTLLRNRPGPTDQTQAQDGSWTMAGDKLTLAASGEATPQVLQVKTVEPDRLVVEREA